MEISVFDQAEGLHGQPEVWVKIQTDNLLDWPRYRAALAPAQAKLLENCESLPCGYHPHFAQPNENPSHKFEEWFVFKQLPTTKVSNL